MNLNAGDVVLFSGNGIISTMIKVAQMSKWSHTGVMLDSHNLLESTTLSNLKNPITGKSLKGVQVVPLRDRMDSYDGDAAFRPLQVAEEFRRIYIKNKLMQFAKDFVGKPYEKNEMELLSAAIDFIKDQEEDLSSLFCSELVAEAYQRCNLLSENIPSNEFTPKDFASEGINKMLRGVSLGKITKF